MVNPGFFYGRGKYARWDGRGYTDNPIEAVGGTKEEALEEEKRSLGKYTAIPIAVGEL